MRISNILLSIAALSLALTFSVAAPRSSQAKDYPYCMSYASGLPGLIESCSYDTLEQCQLGIGGVSGTCFANWRLAYRQQAVRDAAKQSRRAR